MVLAKFVRAIKMKPFLEKLTPGRFFNQNTLTVLFYSALAIHFFTRHYSFSLHSFGRIISQATLENISIGRRIDLFYFLVFFFLASFFILHFLLEKLEQWLDEEDIKIINYFSLMALGTILFNLVGMPAKKSIFFLVHLQIFVLVCAVIEKSIIKKKISCFPDYLWTILIVISLNYFFTALVQFLPPVPCKISLPFCVYLIGLRLAVVLISLSLKDGSLFQKYLYLASTPLAALPLFFCLTMEIYLILNNRELYSFVPYKIYALELLFLMAAGLIVFFFRQKFAKGSISTIVLSFQFPLFLFGLFFCLLYQPFISEPNEVYEAPNMTFMVQQLFEFGKIPFLESFSPHFLSDSFFPFIYAFINGFHGYDICIYNFLVPVFSVLFFYFFFNNIFKEPLLGIYLIFLTPFYFEFTGSLTHQSLYFQGAYTHWVAGIAIFLLIGVLKYNNFISYFALGVYLVFAFLWRVDIGSAALISSFLCLILFRFLPEGHFKINKTALGLSLLLLATVLLSTLITASILKQINLILLAKDFFHLIGADPQNSGFSSFAGYSKQYIFLFHYFVFPAAFLLILIYLLSDFRDILQSDYDHLYLGLLYFIFYYFVMFTRALVRHNILSDDDSFSGGIFYFIFCAALFLILRKHSRILRISIFILAAALFMYIFKVPALRLDHSNLYEKLATKEYVSLPLEEKRIDRIQEYYFSKHFSGFKKLLNEHLEKSETFLDFSNSPMLYFYTHRVTPSYNCHPPSSLFDEYLQKRYINELQNYRVPIAVLSNSKGGLVFDGLPSNLRQYLVADYIYARYEPYCELDGLQLWVLKNDPRFYNRVASLKIPEEQVLPNSPDERSKIFLPLNTPLMIKDNKRYSVRLNYESRRSGFVKLFFQNKQPSSMNSFYLPAGQRTMNIPVDIPENHKRIASIGLLLSHPDSIIIRKADMIEADFSIDSSSGYLPAYEHLKYLPYLQGKYEEKLFQTVSAKQVLAQKQINIINPIKVVRFDFKKNQNFKFNDLKRIDYLNNRLEINTGKDDPYIYGLLSQRIPLLPGHGYRLTLEYESHTGGIIQLYWNTDAKGYNEIDSALHKLSKGKNFLSMDIILPFAQSLDDLRLDPPGNDIFFIHALTLMEFGSAALSGHKFTVERNKHKQNYIILKGSNHSDQMATIELAYGDDIRINGRLAFYMPPRTRDHVYILRPGINYNWHEAQNNTLYVNSDGLDDIEISEIRISPDPNER